MKKILLLDEVHVDFAKMLKSLNYEVDYVEEIDEKKLESIIGNYFGLVIRSKPKITKQILEKAKNLKFIARAGSGIENIDLIYAKEKEIAIINSPEGNSNAVGEHAIGLLISLLKKITSSHIDIAQGKWQREINRGNELAGSTVGIIGYGNTGSSFARKLLSLDVEILVYDKYKFGFGTEKIKECKLNEIKEKADIISFHVPLTDETINYANKEFFESLKNPIILINTSRGKVVNTKDLLQAIENQKVLSAGLDVLDNETYDFDKLQENNLLEKLIQTDKTIITPHVAGITFEAKYKHALILFNKINELKI